MLLPFKRPVQRVYRVPYPLPQKRPRQRSGIARAPKRIWLRHRKFVKSHCCCVPGCGAALARLEDAGEPQNVPGGGGLMRSGIGRLLLWFIAGALPAPDTIPVYRPRPKDAGDLVDEVAALRTRRAEDAAWRKAML